MLPGVGRKDSDGCGSWVLTRTATEWKAVTGEEPIILHAHRDGAPQVHRAVCPALERQEGA